MRSLTIILLLTALHVQAQTSMLTGNSYTYVNDLPNTMKQLALSLGEDVTVASSAPGGYTLFQHATYAPTATAIGSRQWDYVVMPNRASWERCPWM